MIDFRYHLVSIISIFLALAVGIVLGAGPLQQNLGTQLADQVSTLRTEKQQLNDELNITKKQVAAGDDYATAVGSRVVTGRLIGHAVVLIEMPTAESQLADTVEAALRASGAKVNATLRLTDDWFDPTKAAERETAATAAATALGLSSTATGDLLLQEVLTKILTASGAPEAAESRTAALKVLTTAKLLTAPQEQVTPGDLAVIASGDFSGSQDLVDARARSVRSLARLLAQSSRATVVAGGAPVTAIGQPVTSDAVSAIREDSTTNELISTIDHAGQGPGPAIVVLALESALRGTVGHYGVADGATAVVPKVTS